jgi:ribosomal protein S18 acetylase RimI-like enzyme
MELQPGYELTDEIPSVDDYRRLRSATGLQPRSRAAAELGLPNSWAAALVRAADGGVVGMGRVIGDGGCFFQITDMAVLPEHQRRGIGAAILARLIRRLREGAPAGAYVSLLADPPGRALYQRHGFRETAPQEVGMAFVVENGLG